MRNENIVWNSFTSLGQYQKIKVMKRKNKHRRNIMIINTITKTLITVKGSD